MDGFYMIHNLNGAAPKYRHASAALAMNEAERLARQNPGDEFVILKAVSTVTVPKPVPIPPQWNIINKFPGDSMDRAKLFPGSPAPVKGFGIDQLKEAEKMLDALFPKQPIDIRLLKKLDDVVLF